MNSSYLNVFAVVLSSLLPAISTTSIFWHLWILPRCCTLSRTRTQMVSKSSIQETQHAFCQESVDQGKRRRGSVL